MNTTGELKRQRRDMTKLKLSLKLTLLHTKLKLLLRKSEIVRRLPEKR